MAGVYNSRFERSKYAHLSIDQILNLFEKERMENVFLKEDLHNKKMTIKSLHKKLGKLRNENANIASKRFDGDITPDKSETEKLKSTLEDYENIIQRLNDDKRDVSELNAFCNSQKDKIEGYRQNLSKLDVENRQTNRKLLTISQMFEKAKSQNFRNKTIINGISEILTSKISVKKEKFENVMSSPLSEKISVKQENSDQFNLVIPFFEYSQPLKKPEGMFLLNKYIGNCIRSQDIKEKHKYSKMATQYFNRAQSLIFLYPQTAKCVTVSEEALFKNTQNAFPDSINSENDQLTVERHWPKIIEEYRNRKETMPNFLMLFSREKSTDGFKYVLFVVDLGSSTVLRYDPLVEKVVDDEYQHVYLKVFSENGEINKWLKPHLKSEKNGLSWLYCIEFARRFAMMADEESADWIAQNVMKGNPGYNKAFLSIDIDLAIQ